MSADDTKLPSIIIKRRHSTSSQTSASSDKFAAHNIQSDGPAHDSNVSIWVRLNAFLSTRAPNTQLTYKGIIEEWSRFLGAEAGSALAAQRWLAATDLHASAYGAWLTQQPGERPRMTTSQPDDSVRSTAIHTQRRHRTNPRLQKKEGLESTLSNATIAKKFAALRRIYRMLIACDLTLTRNPFDADRVPVPSKEAGRKRPTEMVESALVMTIVSSPDVTQPKGVRDCAILACLFGAGLRRSEVCSLRLGDVRRTPAGTVFLYLRSTKAKRDAQQALPRWAAQYVEDLLAQRRAERASDGDYLCISYTGQAGMTPTRTHISASGIYHLFKHYCGLAGAGAFCTPHSARASAITRLLEQGIPHREVQEFSRHASVQMVELYDKRRISVDQNPAKDLNFDLLPDQLPKSAKTKE